MKCKKKTKTKTKTKTKLKTATAKFKNYLLFGNSRPLTFHVFKGNISSITTQFAGVETSRNESA